MLVVWTPTSWLTYFRDKPDKGLADVKSELTVIVPPLYQTGHL